MTRVPTTMSRRDAVLVPGEFVLTHEDFHHLAGILHADSGISMPESKATLLYSRLAKRLRALGLASFRDYCALVADSGHVDERQRMVAALTTNVTRFFREPHHFEHLKTRVLPQLVERARRGDSIRLWSAGCSNGQEPYSIALTLLSAVPDVARLDIKILATDIDQYMLAEGREGVYGESALVNVPADLRRRWFSPVEGRDGKAWVVAEEVRDLVSFRELNLFGTWPMRKPFQVIFCRNVVIYFEEKMQSDIWAKFTTVMANRSWLYIGHSERLSGPAAGQFRNDGVTTWALSRGAA